MIYGIQNSKYSVMVKHVMKVFGPDVIDIRKL